LNCDVDNIIDNTSLYSAKVWRIFTVVIDVKLNALFFNAAFVGASRQSIIVYRLPILTEADICLTLIMKIYQVSFA